VVSGAVTNLNNMNKFPSPSSQVPSVSDLLETVRSMREDLIRHEQLIEQLMVRVAQCEHEYSNKESTASDKSSIDAWLPPENQVTAAGGLSEQKVRKIEQPNGPPDIFVRLKKSWIGRAYQTYLKHIKLVRWLTIWLWRNLYPFYTLVVARVGSREAKRWRPLVKQLDHVKMSKITTIKVFDAAQVDTPVPKVFPGSDQEHLASPHEHYVFPSVYVAVLENALVYGGTNLVFLNEKVICHDLYDFARDFTSEELHGRHVIDPKKMRLRLLHHDPLPEKIAVAATFLDACASNYAHWLTEVLPRIAAFCNMEQFADVPVIVNDGLHRNIMESLVMIVGPKREIVTLPLGRAVQVDQLYLTSVAGYVPFGKRDDNLKSHSHGLFCPEAFQVIRNRLSPFAAILSRQEWPRKIYLRRIAGARKITNSIDIEKILVKDGYVVVEPEKLSFMQQVALFSNADSVAGPSGAALANLIFSPQTVSLNIFIGKLEGTSYWYWQNIACSSGKYVAYFLGTSVDKFSNFHSDIFIDTETLASELIEGA
jgi:capsular polysaccharide biosynthesis protein